MNVPAKRCQRQVDIPKHTESKLVLFSDGAGEVVLHFEGVAESSIPIHDGLDLVADFFGYCEDRMGFCSLVVGAPGRQYA